MVREAQLKFTRELSGTLTIQSVSADGIRINNDVLSGTIAITTEEVVKQWQSVPVDELVADDFDVLLNDSPELILLGTGASGKFPPRDNWRRTRTRLRRQ